MKFTCKIILSLILLLFYMISTQAQSELLKDTAEYFTFFPKLFDEKRTI
jgi:predicted membrane protein